MKVERRRGELFSTSARLKRAFFLVAIAAAPAALASGCSDDAGSVEMAHVDPGGTFGAELSINVVGRGRVVGDVPDAIDCPGNCFSRVTFSSASSGAGQAIHLRAIPTAGTTFAGWTFEPDLLGARGRGPENCNPVRRTSAQPSIDPRAAELDLPYGEVSGIVPPGQETLCASYAKVPIAYRIKATFETSSVVDPRGDGGNPSDLLFDPQPTQTDAVGKEIGFTDSNGDLFWRVERGGMSTVYWAQKPVPDVPPQELVQGESIDTFVITPFGAVAQSFQGFLSYWRSGNPLSRISLSPPGSRCVALAADANGAYCRTAGPGGSIYSWTAAGIGPWLEYQGLPRGNDLVAGSVNYLFTELGDSPGTGAIRYASKTTGGEGDAFFQTAVSGCTNPTGLRLQSFSTNSGFAWLDPSGAGNVEIHATTSLHGQPLAEALTSMDGVRAVLPDPTLPSRVWIVLPTSILLFDISTSTMRMLRGGLEDVGGIAVAGEFVYWTGSRGRVYRAYISSAKDF